MAAMENDPDNWEAVMRFIKSWLEELAVFSSLVVPALAGAVIAALKQERRRRGTRKLFLSIIMSALCGCGLTPLFAHVFGIPALVSSSLAFFLGIWGLEGVDVVQNVLRSKAGEERQGDFDDDKGL